MTNSLWLIWLIAAYLAGSIPFGLLIGLARGVDIRTQGSGNVGATNAGRVLGKKWGITCFILDVLKGMLPVLGFGLAAGLTASDTAGSAIDALRWIAIAVAAVVGHVFPVWLKFKGGKGVATGLGVLLGLWPVLTVPGLVAAVVWFAVIKASGYVSLASVLASISLPLLTLISGLAFGKSAGEIAVYTSITALLGLLVVVRHRSNIRRLREGTESKARWAKRD